ncbi:MAG: hypothetical protein AAF525_17965 [Pseudomonadota bacterium]
MFPCSLNDVMLAFLRAELDSPTERGKLLQCLRQLNIDEALLRSEARVDAVTVFDAYRGFEAIFEGFPWESLAWGATALNHEDVVGSVDTCRHNFERRYGTRRLQEVVFQLEAAEQDQLRGILTKVLLGQRLEPPILVRESATSNLVIVEGHNRMMAYLLFWQELDWPVDVLVGTGLHVSSWVEWPASSS